MRARPYSRSCKTAFRRSFSTQKDSHSNSSIRILESWLVVPSLDEIEDNHGISEADVDGVFAMNYDVIDPFAERQLTHILI